MPIQYNTTSFDCTFLDEIMQLALVFSRPLDELTDQLIQFVPGRTMRRSTIYQIMPGTLETSGSTGSKWRGKACPDPSSQQWDVADGTAELCSAAVYPAERQSYFAAMCLTGYWVYCTGNRRVYNVPTMQSFWLDSRNMKQTSPFR